MDSDVFIVQQQRDLWIDFIKLKKLTKHRSLARSWQHFLDKVAQIVGWLDGWMAGPYIAI